MAGQDEIRVAIVGGAPSAAAALRRQVCGWAGLRLLPGSASAAQVTLWVVAGGSAAPPAGPDPVIALVDEPDDLCLALRAEVAGILDRAAPSARIAAAILAVHSGLWVVAPECGAGERGAGFSVPPRWAWPRSACPASPFRRAASMDGAERGQETLALSARERQVLALVCAGLSNRRIAARLGVSPHTVKFHVNNILFALGAPNRTAAAVRAVALGMPVSVWERGAGAATRGATPAPSRRRSGPDRCFRGS